MFFSVIDDSTPVILYWGSLSFGLLVVRISLVFLFTETSFSRVSMLSGDLDRISTLFRTSLVSGLMRIAPEGLKFVRIVSLT